MALSRVGLVKANAIDTAQVKDAAITLPKTSGVAGGGGGSDPLQSWIKRNQAATDLFWNLREDQAFRHEIQITDAGLARLVFQAQIRHRGDQTGVTGVVGVSVRLNYRFAASQAALGAASESNVPYGVDGTNILNLEHHYAPLRVPGLLFPVVPGWYRFSAFLSAHSSLSSIDGMCCLATTSPPSDYNFFQVEFYKGGTRNGP